MLNVHNFFFQTNEQSMGVQSMGSSFLTHYVRIGLRETLLVIGYLLSVISAPIGAGEEHRAWGIGQRAESDLIGY